MTTEESCFGNCSVIDNNNNSNEKEEIDYTERVIFVVVLYIAIFVFTPLTMKCIYVLYKKWEKKEWKDIGTVENRNNDREGAVEEVNIDTALLLE